MELMSVAIRSWRLMAATWAASLGWHLMAVMSVVIATATTNKFAGGKEYLCRNPCLNCILQYGENLPEKKQCSEFY